jgi:DNA polymerase-3 subunit beta
MNNINIKASTLASLLQNVVGVVSRSKSSMPELAHILLKYSKDTLSVTATDLEVQLSSSTKNVEGSGDVVTTIPGTSAFEIIRSLEEEQIEISISESSVKIKSPNSSFKLQPLSSTEFQKYLFEAPGADTTFKIKQKEIKRLVNKTAMCIPLRDIGRPYLNGIFLKVAPNTLVAVASDGNRLAKSKASIDKANIPEEGYLIPTKAVHEVQRLIGDEGDVKITLSDNRAVFDIGTTTLVTSLIESTFPDYKAMKQFQNLYEAKNIILDKRKLKTALQRVLIIVKERKYMSRIDIENNTLTISGVNRIGERATEAIPIEGVYNKISIGFNAKFLLDAVSAGQGEMVSLGLNDTSKGSLIADPSDPKTEYVIMPLIDTSPSEPTNKA